MRFHGRQINFLIAVTLLLTGCKPKEENGIIDDGIYEVKFHPTFDGDPNLYEDYKLTIVGVDYTKQFKGGHTENGKIEKLYADKFRLTDLNENEIPLDSLSDFQKGIRHWGPPCFELAGTNGDTLRFRTTFSGQLHININTGIIIKKQ